MSHVPAMSPSGSAFVDLADVSLRYGDANGTLALSGVDLAIEKGAIRSHRRPFGLRQVLAS